MPLAVRMSSWFRAVALAGIFASIVAGQALLETFPTTEFSSYTSAAQDVNMTFTVKVRTAIRTVALHTFPNTAAVLGSYCDEDIAASISSMLTAVARRPVVMSV